MSESIMEDKKSVILKYVITYSSYHKTIYTHFSLYFTSLGLTHLHEFNPDSPKFVFGPTAGVRCLGYYRL